MARTTMTVGALKELHAAFWQVQADKLSRLMADTAVRSIALQDLAHEIVRGVDHGFRHSLEGMLEKYDEARQSFRQADGKKGGRPIKGDRLQRWIEGAVRKNPTITEDDLRRLLEAIPYGKFICEVQANQFTYLDDRGQMQDVPFSRLKSRLYRAKRKLLDEKALVSYPAV